MGNQTLCLAMMSVLPVAIISFLSSTATAQSQLSIFPPGGEPYGLSYSEHIKNFWKWILEIPANDNPTNDDTGDKCSIGQLNTNSSVFYLAFNNGGNSDRTCKVPAGKALFIPVMQVEISDKESPGSSDAQLAEAAKNDQDSVNSLYLKIGDKEYNFDELQKYRTATDIFEVDYADNGIFGIVEGGPSKVAADGFYIITEPLKKGTYPVHFKSSLICTGEECTEANFVQDIKYNIIVE
jgi:hypothetical protein